MDLKGDSSKVATGQIRASNGRATASNRTVVSNVPEAVQGVAEQPASSSSGLAKPAADGVSTKIVPAKPCSTAAHETDGTTTCVGIPNKRESLLPR
jgi:hypothetical protein